MSLLSSALFNFKGQSVQSVTLEESSHSVLVKCKRDRRCKVVDPETGAPRTVDHYVHRRLSDLPVSGRPCVIEIELAQTRDRLGRRLIEATDFVDKGSRYTKRFCHFISGLCRYMSIHAVSKHLDIRWETVKNIDKAFLLSTLPALEPKKLTNLVHIGVDEVARAKGHDYMTVVYDLVSGQLIWVDHGRTSNVLINFFEQLSPQTRDGIQAVSMDMGQSYQSAVRNALPKADIVFDRFHVMQNYSLLIRKERNKAFRKGTHDEKKMLKGTLFLLLKNAPKLSDNQSDRLDDLLESNKTLCTIYMLKEQLQALWDERHFDLMIAALDAWCQLAKKTRILSLINFSDALWERRVGICNYAKYKLTNARVEAGNVSIGLLRRRARGVRDTDYFKLKIRQTSILETHSTIYPEIKLI
ncbi:ISL3-like element ISVa7 family transposase [Vibrio aestuarianus subsp. cardii]|uniref:ISL3-like element ISVa7 family transposase n=1 Tax=Vibrio aestuarianus TaxID=28171 RepID=UPI0015943E9A|nr:ISL3-like element ISVa7 family transposase [Vibrio aestuarianus]MDE1311293.1 ISL3-like element ISVa7 family transposase [Vibrio aestuarianus]MDE1311721.1 ISL3-like element ISVa7 family transposase [Vibrio aestuarianus]MDE1311906.1 ISL3-like element ISVa7 family transposase [Vibrio aestuarianus]MDE1311907.1 ISL3-like element ISVa7 family transposase [Vibrio aestuarianus]MDE1312154.1 ISL3-like element ISVa7 family transposase [Vibrio aestuarianus]